MQGFAGIFVFRQAAYEISLIRKSDPTPPPQNTHIHTLTKEPRHQRDGDPHVPGRGLLPLLRPDRGRRVRIIRGGGRRAAPDPQPAAAGARASSSP